MTEASLKIALRGFLIAFPPDKGHQPYREDTVGSGRGTSKWRKGREIRREKGARGETKRKAEKGGGRGRERGET